MVQLLNRSSNSGSRRLQRRHDVRRLEILAAAGKAFRKNGFHQTGMREIAEAADLSTGNLYYYYKSKIEILYFCQDRSLDTMLLTLEAARRKPGNGSEKLRQVIEAHVHCVLDEVEGSTAHLEMEALPADLRRRLIQKRDRYERGIRALIARGSKSGEFASCDPSLVTRALLGSLNETVRWFRPEGSRSAGEVAREFASYLLRGLRPEKGKP